MLTESRLLSKKISRLTHFIEIQTNNPKT